MLIYWDFRIYFGNCGIRFSKYKISIRFQIVTLICINERKNIDIQLVTLLLNRAQALNIFL